MTRTFAILGLVVTCVSACDSASGTDASVGDSASPIDTGVPRDAGPFDAGALDAGPVVPPPTGCPAPGAVVADPYRWYPGLDLARIPFHGSDGAWGARMPISAPEPPATTRSITVTTADELEREGLVAGSEITVGANIDRTVTLLGDVMDLDLIVPPGITMSNINVGRASPPSMSRRVRIRGTTPGEHSGGRLGTVTLFSDFADAGESDAEYAWIADNVLVDPNEARIVWAAALPGSTSPWDGFWAVCNTVYAHSDTSAGCLGHSFEAPDATYARLTNNTFFGTVTEADQAARVVGDQDYTTDNTYAAWRAPPAWDAPGDPRTIPLPAPASPSPQDPMCPGPP